MTSNWSEMLTILDPSPDGLKCTHSIPERTAVAPNSRWRHEAISHVWPIAYASAQTISSVPIALYDTAQHIDSHELQRVGQRAMASTLFQSFIAIALTVFHIGLSSKHFILEAPKIPPRAFANDIYVVLPHICFRRCLLSETTFQWSPSDEVHFDQCPGRHIFITCKLSRRKMWATRSDIICNVPECNLPLTTLKLAKSRRWGRTGRGRHILSNANTGETIFGRHTMLRRNNQAREVKWRTICERSMLFPVMNKGFWLGQIYAY